MKTNFNTSVLVSFIACCTATHLSISEEKDTQIRSENQHFLPEHLKISRFFEQPEYTTGSIEDFLQQVYNHHDYAQKFLALNFSHVETFLSFSDRADQSRSYIQSVLKLFGQKMKAARYINGFAFDLFLQKLPAFIAPHLQPVTQSKKTVVLECLENLFSEENFKRLQANPYGVLDEFADNILQAISSKESDASLKKVQQAVAQFMEIGLSKLIWSPEDQQDVWICFKTLAGRIENLYNLHIIKDSTVLDELYWTLIYQYCHFLDVVGHQLKHECYHEIHKDLRAQDLPMLKLEEIEQCITTKHAYLHKAVTKAEVRCRAYHAGLITDMLAPTL